MAELNRHPHAGPCDPESHPSMLSSLMTQTSLEDQASDAGTPPVHTND